MPKTTTQAHKEMANMRLVHQVAMRYQEKAFFYFKTHFIDTDDLDSWQDISDEELSHLKGLLPKIQYITDTVLGHNIGVVQVDDALGENSFLLTVPDNISRSDNVKSLIGWIELFQLDGPPQDTNEME